MKPGDIILTPRKTIPAIVGIIPARYASTRFPGKPLHLIAGKPLLHNVPFDVKGTPVRVFKGPFKDLHGQFVRRRGKNVIVVKITRLSRAVEMEIDEAFVERT